jgi:hypothetical protein
VTIKDGRVVEYRFQDRPIEITESNISGDTVTFSNPLFQYSVTRIGPAKATIQAKNPRGELSTGALTKVDESWNGTWSGMWTWSGGSASGSITILDGRVTEYLYNRVPQTIARDEVLPERVTFGSSSYQITIARTGPATANADYAHVNGNSATARLTKGGSAAAGDKAARTQPPPKAKTAEKSSSARAWCENDCRSLCAKVAASVESCVTQYSCSKYPANPCAGPAAVNARAAQIQGGTRAGSTAWYYEDCAAKCDAGSPTPEERSYCYTQICARYPKRGK